MFFISVQKLTKLFWAVKYSVILLIWSLPGLWKWYSVRPRSSGQPANSSVVVALPTCLIAVEVKAEYGFELETHQGSPLFTIPLRLISEQIPRIAVIGDVTKSACINST